MKYEAWTPESVRDRVVEAADTLSATPNARGPLLSSGAFSDLIHEHIATEYDRAPSYRRILSPGALTRMEQTWEWINSYLDEVGRKLIYDYGFIKSRKGFFLQAYLDKNDLVRRTFERKIIRYCQVIANNLNRKLIVRLTGTLDAVSQNAVDLTPTKISSQSYANHWMTEDGKPHIDPALPLQRSIDHRDIRARHSDRNRSLGIRQ